MEQSTTTGDEAGADTAGRDGRNTPPKGREENPTTRRATRKGAEMDKAKLKKKAEDRLRAAVGAYIRSYKAYMNELTRQAKVVDERPLNKDEEGRRYKRKARVDMAGEEVIREAINLYSYDEAKA